MYSLVVVVIVGVRCLIEYQFERGCKIVLGLQWVFERSSYLEEVTVVLGD